MVPKKKSGAGKWLGLVIIIIAAFSILIYFITQRDSKIYENVKAQRADIVTYNSFSGNIEAKYRQLVISETVMQLSEIFVNEGDFVEKGDILAETSTGGELTAEINGEVTNLNIEKNAVVMAGSRLMEIVDFTNLQVNVRVDEYDLSALKTGESAKVKIGALNKEIEGKINTISREGVVMNGLTYYTATIGLKSDTALRVGMSAEVRLVKNTVRNAVTIPMSAVSFDENNTPYVLKESTKGKPVRVDIKTGINNGLIVEVKEGIADGETILFKSPDAAMGVNFRGRRPSDNNSGGGSK